MSFFSNRRQSDTDVDKQPHKPIPQHPVGFETVLGAGSAMEGSLTTKGNVRLDGDFTGTLNIQGNVLVGETAKINADIEARNISIAGAVRGNVNGNKVQLLRTGRIWGDIKANALTTEEGAFIDGKITMKSHEANRPATPVAPIESEPTGLQQADGTVESSASEAVEQIESSDVDDSPTELLRPRPEPVIGNAEDDTIVDRRALTEEQADSDDEEDND